MTKFNRVFSVSPLLYTDFLKYFSLYIWVKWRNYETLDLYIIKIMQNDNDKYKKIIVYIYKEDIKKVNYEELYRVTSSSIVI